VRDGRSRGLTYADIVAGSEGPLVIELVTDLVDSLLRSGSHLRRAEARALYAEGLTMEKISLLLRVSHQRISAIIRTDDNESIGSARAELSRTKALALTDTEFRMIAEVWPQIVWVVGPNGSAEYVNRLGVAYAGLSVEETSGGGWEAIVHPDDRADVLRLWAQAVDEGVAFELKYRMRRFDGEYRWHLSRCAPIKNAAGVVMKWIGIATDVEGEEKLRDDLGRALRDASEARAMLQAIQPGSSAGDADETASSLPLNT
jgi:PAS domain S-box-containing protein